MRLIIKPKPIINILLSSLVLSLGLTGCVSNSPVFHTTGADEFQIKENASPYLVAIEEEPNTVDFQHTTIYYTVAQNVFQRLVDMDNDQEGNAVVYPSLARSWEISPDLLTYTFHLEEGVRFSNGSPFTSQDVLYSFTRLLTDPDSANGDILACVEGARELTSGQAQTLEGIELLDDYTLTITLREPFCAFLACLSMPGASIMDEETTTQAGDRFGSDPAWTIGTGPFILQSWEKGEGMVFLANQDCWSGAPGCAGLDLRFTTDPEHIRVMFEEGELDLLNLDDIGKGAEYFLHGSLYEGRIHEIPQISITYVALNESIPPLSKKEVRKALQLSLNRPMLLDAAYSGNGQMEQGIMPHGLHGYNPDLEEIPYDPDQASLLLKEAGYPDGFDLTISMSSACTQNEVALVRAAVSMWEKMGIRATIQMLDSSEFLAKRKAGELSCYFATWYADYNDPDNFLYPFFGDEHNTTYRSLCYPREEIRERIRNARQIVPETERIEEYQSLERIIVHEDAAWIPLFSRSYFYVASQRIDGIPYYWNGSVKGKYSKISIIRGKNE